MALIHGFICDCCQQEFRHPSGNWEFRAVKTEFHTPPDGVNGGHWEFEHTCHDCRQRLFTAIQKTVERQRNRDDMRDMFAAQFAKEHSHG